MKLQRRKSAQRWFHLFIWLAAGLLALAVLGGGTLAAADAGDTLTPAALTIAGVQGEVVTRTVTLRLPSDAADISFVAQDLATEDGTHVLPASAIRATPPTTATLASAAAAIPTTATVTVVTTASVSVNLVGAESGSYSGQALLLYRTPVAGGGSLLHEAPLALTVTVKQPGLLPLIVLVGGLLLGWGLTLYRTQGRPRDQLLSALGDSRNRIEADLKLASGQPGQDFGALANAAMEDALSALRQGAIDDAQQQAKRATDILDLWQRQRSDWLGVLERRNELLKAIPAGHQAAFVLNVRDAIGNAPHAEIAAALEDGLQKKDWRDYVNALQTRLEKLRIFKLEYDTLERRIKAAIIAGQTQLNTALATLNELNPVADEAGYRSKYAELTETVAAAERAIPPAVAADKRGLAQGQTAEAGAAELLVSLFNMPMSGAELGRSPWPRLRLWLFVIVSFIVGWLLLAGAGFNELYVQKATFGANMFGDYLALFAWGFGAEASRDAITALVRGWGLPVGGEQE